MDRGFITPSSLHYVRNHGAVLRIEWGQHRLTITGLVDRPVTLDMDTLISSFPLYTVLCTMACAGNRYIGQHRNHSPACARPFSPILYGSACLLLFVLHAFLTGLQLRCLAV